MYHFLLTRFVQPALLQESSLLHGIAMLTIKFYGLLVNDYQEMSRSRYQFLDILIK
jgi:hypothetical protein